MKDHERRELVNELTRIAREFGNTQQLRERIAHALPDEEIRPFRCRSKSDREEAMSERTALEVASRLEALMPIAGKSAAEMLRSQHAEIEHLRAFAKAVMDCWPDGWGIEGDELQHIATEHGMLIPEIKTDPCGDACRCAEHVLPKEWTDGVVCYRKTALLTGVEK